MQRFHPLLPALMLMASCAVNHQPVSFDPFFPDRPDGEWNARIANEERTLAAKENLTQLEKKRYLDLLTAELQTLKRGSARFDQVQKSIAGLNDATSKLQREVAELQSKNLKRENKSESEAPPAFTLPALRKAYIQAYQFWNRDQNETALQKINEILQNAEWKTKSQPNEWYKVLFLKFRVSLDLGDLNSATAMLTEIQSIQSCSNDTARAAFLIALHHFGRGDADKAYEIFEGQCDPDESPAELIRRKYWESRLREKTDPEDVKDEFVDMATQTAPLYYVFAAAERLGARWLLPQTALQPPNPRSYLETEISVPGSVDSLLTAGEERIRLNLRRDASVYLTRASQILKEDPDKHVAALLYTAHLLKAAGNHLEAMKIYTLLTTPTDDEFSHSAESVDDFWDEMFPRPFQGKVESLAKMWGVDPDFLYAIMRQESAFNPLATSGSDARGLMQLMPFLARSIANRWNFQNYYQDRVLYFADENLKMAAYHISQLKHSADHVALMAAAYNAGLVRTVGWWKKFGSYPLDVFIELIPIQETRNYVKLVIRNYLYYKALRGGGTVDPKVIPWQLPTIPQNFPPWT